MPTASAYRLLRSLPPPVPLPELDPDQRRVVEHADGPLLVLAGPGTGKTTTLVEAVAARVRRGTRPDRVLVLTFGRRAADELRERIAVRLGVTASEPAAHTFHSWAYALVRAFDTPPGAAPVRLLSEAERDVRVHELLVGNAAGEGVTVWPSSLRPAVPRRGFAREVADLLDRARERGLDAETLRRLGAETGRPAWVSAGTFADEYLSVLAARGELDYAELVRRAVDLVRGETGEEIRSRYDAVFVDEYQDTDPAQEQLLLALAGGGRDLVVVGDPDQSIYAFRGADVRCLLDFPDRFRTPAGEPAAVLALGASRRAGPETLAPARAVAARLPLPGLSGEAVRRHRSPMAGGPPALAAPEIRIYPTVAEEVTAIADLLRRAHVQQGLPWEEMAVLVRSGTRSIPVLRRALGAAGVPVAVATDEVAVARDPAVVPLLAALTIAAAGSWAELGVEEARTLLLSPLGRAVPSGLRLLGRRLRAIERAAGAAVPTPSAQLLRDALADPRTLAGEAEWWAEPVRRVHGVVQSAAEVLAGGGSAEDALWALWDGSGWAGRAARESFAGGRLGRSADRDLDAVLAVFTAASRLEERRPRGGVAALRDELAAQVIPAAPAEERPTAGQRVRLLTAHRAKGLEWDLVVVAGVQHGQWPDLRQRGSLLEPAALGRDGTVLPPGRDTLLVEERRLFYVALTRARRRLVVTAVSSVGDGGERPSRFLEDMGLAVPATTLAGTALLSPGSLVARLRRALVDPAAGPQPRTAAAGLLAELAAATDGSGRPLVPAADPDAWWGVRALTPGARPVRPGGRLALSASAVASYETCPLRSFFEREVGARPVTSAAQGFGSVVHALASAASAEQDPPGLEELTERLDAVWPALGFDAPWIAERDRGAARRTLEVFLGWLATRSRDFVGAETPFRLDWGEDVTLSGSIDRVERAADGRVRVVDLKTSKTPRTRKVTESDPQLAVYQLVVRDGGLPSGAAEPDGAELVYLRKERANGLPTVVEQPAIAQGWADALVRRTAEGLRAEAFAARPGEQCATCAFDGSCPAQGAGRQVTT